MSEAVQQRPRRRAEQPPTTPPAGQAPEEVAPRRELSEEEKSFLDALTGLVTSAQELSYALAAIDVTSLGDTPEARELVESARNVVKSVWRFHRLVKSRMGAG